MIQQKKSFDLLTIFPFFINIINNLILVIIEENHRKLQTLNPEAEVLYLKVFTYGDTDCITLKSLRFSP